MRLGVLNQDLGIMVVDGIDDISYLQMKEIKSKLPDGQNLDSLAFFYMSDRDWIVINKEHKLYEYYSQVIPVYLELSKEKRNECIIAAPSKVMGAFELLEYVLMCRELRGGNFCEKA